MTPATTSRGASPWLGAGVAAAIAGAVSAAEYAVNESWLTAAGLIVAPLLGGWLAPAVREDDPILGWLTFRMAALAVVLGALATAILWSGGIAYENLAAVVGIAVLGLVIFGVPMFAVTLLCAMLWTFLVRVAARR